MLRWTISSFVVLAALAAPATAPAARIAFVSERDGNSEIYVMDEDGSNQRNLTRRAGDDQSPAWSPDGSLIAYTRGFGSDADVWVMNADGSGAHRLLDREGADRDPTWSPDGRRLAFSGDRGDGPEIHVVDADGGGERTVTSTGGVASGPAWSPDGGRIAFWREDISQLRTVPAAGGADAALGASADDADRDPAWSADGARLAFASYRDPALDLDVWGMNRDGSGRHVLASSPARDIDPAWSADDRLAFATDRDGDLEIYVGSQRLTTSSGDDSMPAWEPPPPVALTPEPAGDEPASGPGPSPGAAPPPGGAPGDTAAPAPTDTARRGRLRVTLLRSSRVILDPRRLRLRLRLRLTGPAVVTLELRVDGRRLVRLERRVRRGVNTLRWSRAIGDRKRWHGRRYEVFLVALRPGVQSRP